MREIIHTDSAADKGWSAPQLKKLGTLADVAGTAQTPLTQTTSNKS